MSLALATLIYEWRRYLAAIIALAFSGLLILAQVGMFMGMGKAFTANIDRARGDIMVLGPKAESLMNGGAGLPARVKPALYTNPAVVDVGEVMVNGGMWQNDPGPGKKRKREFAQAYAVDTWPDAVTLPIDFSEDLRVALLEPYGVAVDKTALARLGVKLGDKGSLNGKTVRVVAVLDNYPNMNAPMVFMSRDTLRKLGMNGRADRTGALIVRIKDPAQALTVRDQLNAASGGAYRAWTRAELSEANQGALLKEQIIGIMLVFSLFVGMLIGVGITSQTLRGAILANIKEFASLRALGVGMGSLRMIVLELSFWVGIAGLGATGLMTAGIALLASAGGLPMAFPLGIVSMVGIFLVTISMLSGLMALGILKKSQPADLLR
ncbi:ABC transporter permease [Caulobacter segnis]|uniref:ABC transporter permease n=1 Tax=Caulobacter segnis TaxID=88688 RepID=UPI00240F4751|nr:ABC transporter permease [Caulobacter segnis]MDG2522746.1 ABC transporter permease [Caulobacter segnis]